MKNNMTKIIIGVVVVLILLLGIWLVAGHPPAVEQPEPVAEAPEPEELEEPEEPEEPEKRPWRIIFVNALVGHPVYNEQDRGIRAAVKDIGSDVVDVQIVGSSDTSALAERTIEVIDSAIAMRPDALVIEPWDPSMFAAHDRAVAAGIPVAAVSNKPHDMDKVFAFIGTDFVQHGIMAADALAEKTNGRANIMIKMSTLDISNQVAAREAFEARIKEKYPEMRVVLVDYNRADLAIAMEKFDAAFRAYPEIDTVFMLEGTGAQAAAAIAREQNREIVILGVDATKETLDGIRRGEIWATLAQNFYRRGYETIRYAYYYLTGNKDKFEKVNDSGLVLVTKENVDLIEQMLIDATRKVGETLR